MSLRPQLGSLACAGLAFLIVAGCSRELVAPVASRDARMAGITKATARENLPPSTAILDPIPSTGYTAVLQQPVTIQWTGSDLDGHVREYRYRLFSSENPDFPGRNFIAYFKSNPDSVLHFYAPDFPGWNRVRARKSSPVESVTYPTLVPDQFYVFAAVAIDNRNAHDVNLWIGRNAVEFVPLRPEIPWTFGFVGPFGTVTYPSDPVVVPAGQPVTVRWFATSSAGLGFEGYRSSLDEPDFGVHSPADTMATISPPTVGQTRLLWVSVLRSDGYASFVHLVLSFTGSAFPTSSANALVRRE